jgi:hypothetical protein
MLVPWLCRRDEQPPELQPLPRYCFHVLFEEGRQLLHLTELVVDGLSIEEMEGWAEWVQVRLKQNKKHACRSVTPWFQT